MSSRYRRRTGPLGNASNKSPVGIDILPAIRSTASAASCAPAPSCSPTSKALAWTPVFADEKQVEAEASWGVYQGTVAAYHDTKRAEGKAALTKVIASTSQGVPAELSEIIKLGHTLKRRVVDVLAYFDRPQPSNGPTEAINGRLEHLRGPALGFRNRTNYIARSPLEAGGFRLRLHPLLRGAA